MTRTILFGVAGLMLWAAGMGCGDDASERRPSEMLAGWQGPPPRININVTGPDADGDKRERCARVARDNGIIFDPAAPVQGTLTLAGNGNRLSISVNGAPMREEPKPDWGMDQLCNDAILQLLSAARTAPQTGYAQAAPATVTVVLTGSAANADKSERCNRVVTQMGFHGGHQVRRCVDLKRLRQTRGELLMVELIEYRPGSARAAQLKLWTDNLGNDRLNCVEGRTQCTLEVVPLGQELRCVVAHGDRTVPVLPDEHLEREIQTRDRSREHYRRTYSRLPEHDEFRVGHLHANSFGSAAVINDPEQREASIRDHTRQLVDGLCDGLAAVLGGDPGQRLRVVQHQDSCSLGLRSHA
jgi:hypothetical protein